MANIATVQQTLLIAMPLAALVSGIALAYKIARSVSEGSRSVSSTLAGSLLIVYIIVLGYSAWMLGSTWRVIAVAAVAMIALAVVLALDDGSDTPGVHRLGTTGLVILVAVWVLASLEALRVHGRLSAFSTLLRRHAAPAPAPLRPPLEVEIARELGAVAAAGDRLSVAARLELRSELDRRVPGPRIQNQAELFVKAGQALRQSLPSAAQPQEDVGDSDRSAAFLAQT